MPLLFTHERVIVICPRLERRNVNNFLKIASLYDYFQSKYNNRRKTKDTVRLLPYIFLPPPPPVIHQNYNENQKNELNPKCFRKDATLEKPSEISDGITDRKKNTHHIKNNNMRKKKRNFTAYHESGHDCVVLVYVLDLHVAKDDGCSRVRQWTVATCTDSADFWPYLYGFSTRRRSPRSRCRRCFNYNKTIFFV